ncbi:MAG: DUF1573 domain-containing protein [Actinomycetia bacterium]|nr:DUF1573 domain-containing protein [Actinomycetes bacterium]
MAKIKDSSCSKFQNTVENTLVRHRSILDVLTKLQEGTTRVNRAVAKSVTNCDCLKINAEKQVIPEKATLKDVSKYTSTHISGKLCSNCKEIIETELGTTLFYLTALCVLLDLDLYEIMEKENDRMEALGIFSLT